MDKLRKESNEQDLKGSGQKIKGKIQEGVGRLTDNEDMEARGHLNQAGGEIRHGVAGVGRKVSDSLDPDRGSDRDRDLDRDRDR